MSTIRVKDFAKVELFHNTNNNVDTKSTTKRESQDELPINIETISLSSNDDFEPIKSKVVKRTPKPKLTRQTPSKRPLTTPNRSSKKTATPSRSLKTPLNFKNHKISEYFGSAKKVDGKSF